MLSGGTLIRSLWWRSRLACSERCCEWWEKVETVATERG